MKSRLSEIADQSLQDLEEWQNDFGEYSNDPVLSVPDATLESVFGQLSRKLKGNYPFHHPVYAGQMLKPPHAVARYAYHLAMHINPNNHALDGGPPSSEMEKEGVEQLARFFGYQGSYLGHLTASGTIGNLEALWIARESHPGKKIAFSTRSHYTHERMSGVLGVETVKIPVLPDGSFDLDSTNPGEIGSIVVTMGTTGLGDVEPLEQILPWAKENGIRVHLDAAYGGFFKTLQGTGRLNDHRWELTAEADSIVIDPHKHGLQPYGCGAVLFKDPEVGRFYKHDSPYTYFTSDDLHLGEISLECSRAGAAAVALWATLKCFPLKHDEGFGPIMRQCLNAASEGYDQLVRSGKLHPYKNPELDILTYYPVDDDTSTLNGISRLSEKVFEQGMKDKNYYLSLYKVSSEDFLRMHPGFDHDTDTVTILRSVLMKPEHASFIPELISRIEAAV